MKLTKKQIAALKLLLLDLDELENKPHRLFHSLEDFAFAFDRSEAVPSIREAQDMYYENWNKGEFFRDIFSSLKKYKTLVWKRQIDNKWENYDCNSLIKGASEYIDLLSENLLKIKS